MVQLMEPLQVETQNSEDVRVVADTREQRVGPRTLLLIVLGTLCVVMVLACSPAGATRIAGAARITSKFLHSAVASKGSPAFMSSPGFVKGADKSLSLSNQQAAPRPQLVSPSRPSMAVQTMVPIPTAISVSVPSGIPQVVPFSSPKVAEPKESGESSPPDDHDDEIGVPIPPDSTHLKTLWLEGMHVGDLDIFELVKHSTHLRDIRLSGTMISDAGVVELSKHCAHAMQIRLSSTKISDVGLTELARHCAELQQIRLSSTGVTDAGVIDLADHMHDLKVVHLQGTKISDKGISHLAKKCPLREVAFSFTDVTDDGVIELSKNCKNLKRVYMQHTQITNAGVKELANRCPKLERVWLAGSQVTEEGKRELRGHFVEVFDGTPPNFFANGYTPIPVIEGFPGPDGPVTTPPRTPVTKGFKNGIKRTHGMKGALAETVSV